MDQLEIALFQYDIIWEQKQANLNQILEWVKELPKKTDLIVLPEMFSTGFTMNPQPFAEGRDGFIIKRLHQWSEEFGFAFCGSMITKVNKQYKNAMFLLEDQQEVQWYEKKHLFSYGGESSSYTAGTERTCFEFKNWRIFPFICYDLRFPVWMRNDQDIDLYIGVANWPHQRVDAWSQLLRARAIENQAYVVGVNRIGGEPSGLWYNGMSAGIDYSGQPIIELTGKEYALMSCSKTNLEAFRSKLPFLKDRDRFIIK